jgi:hypothetical protein
LIIWFDFPKQFLIAAICIGSVMVLVSIFGTCAIHLKGCNLLSILLMIVLIAGQITIGYLALKAKENPGSTLSEQWNGFSQQHKKQIQELGKCCGFDNNNDRFVVSTNCPTSAKIDGYYVNAATYIGYSLLGLAGFEVLFLFWSLFRVCGCFNVRKEYMSFEPPMTQTQYYT